jgi:hypothetical protein
MAPKGDDSVARRTVNLPDSVDALVREIAEEGESYSAAVTRLLLAGAHSIRGKKRPSYVGTGEGPRDLGRLAERYLRKLVKAG